MRTVLGIFPVIKRLNEASNVPIPVEMIRDLSGMCEPEQINEIAFQYRIWTYLSGLETCCEGCGGYLPIGSRSTSQTCSNRCHLLVKRATNKGNDTPMEVIRKESAKKLSAIMSVWEKSKTFDYKTDFAWHKVHGGWKVASTLEE